MKPSAQLRLSRMLVFWSVPMRLLFALLLMLGLLEIGSRVTCCEVLNPDARTHYDVASARLQVRTPGVPGYRWKPNSVLDGRPFTNNLGLAMDHDVAPTPAPGVQRLIAIGASTTQGDPPEAAYPRQLQQLLDSREPGRWEVVNAGHQGYTIEATLALLRQKLVALHPDVLVYYGEINDLIVR